MTDGENEKVDMLCGDLEDDDEKKKCELVVNNMERESARLNKIIDDAVHKKIEPYEKRLADLESFINKSQE